MSRQRTLFGSILPNSEIDHVVYSKPSNDFENLIERHCRRQRKSYPHMSKKQLNDNAIAEWNKVRGNQEAIDAYLRLQPGERPLNQSVPVIDNSKRCEGFFKRSTESSVESVSNLSKNHSKGNVEKSHSDSSNTVNDVLTTSKVSDLSAILDSETDKQCLNKNILEQRVRSFLYVYCPSLATDDVLQNQSFIDAIADNISKINEFILLSEQYTNSLQRRIQYSELQRNIKDIHKSIQVLKDSLSEAAAITIDISKGLHNLSVTAAQKNTLLTKCVTSASSSVSLIKVTNILYKIRKQMKQNKKKEDAKIESLFKSEISVKCFNSDVAWIDAYERFETSISLKLPISKKELQVIASAVEEECFVDPETVIPNESHVEITDALLMHFPILLAERPTKKILINIAELQLQPEAFLTLLQGHYGSKEDKPTTSQAVNTTDISAGSTNKSSGRVPFHAKYPELVEVATNFIKSHSFAAHNRRRNSVGTGTGVSLRNIQEHVIENVPGLKEAGGISVDAIHNLFVPPNKNSSRAHLYKSLIQAKIPKKRNDYRENSDNQHYLFSRVKYREEFASRFNDECSFFSCDDMNKLKMSPATAVSRYHQQFRFFMEDDSPNLHDHDFVNPGYLIVPSGYMRLDVTDKGVTDQDRVYFDVDENDLTKADQDSASATEAPHSTDSSTTTDKLGRMHYPRLEAGPAQVVLRPCKFNPSSAQNHVNDMIGILRSQVADGKGIAFLKVDNGSDWNLLSLVNEIFFSRLWRDSKLDLLVILSYAAKWSAYNNVEHLWSPMSRYLANVILRAILEQDDKPPCQQSGLSSEELREKEAKVFDQAMKEICETYWKDVTFNDAEVTSRFQGSLEVNAPFNDYDEIHKLLSGSMNVLRKHTELINEIKFMVNHMERKSHEIIFSKCSNSNCLHCSKLPIVSVNAWNYLSSIDFKWPNPLPSQTHPGHFMTFMEMCDLSSDKYVTGDAGLPKSNSIGVCPYCPKYLFMSNADKNRHLGLLHYHCKGDGNRVWKREFRCLHINNKEKCNLLFSSAWQLREHRKKSGHLKRKKQPNPAQQIEARNKNKKQLKLTDVTLPRNQVADKDATEMQKGPEIEPNTSTTSKIDLTISDLCAVCRGSEESDDEDSEEGVDWVQCDDCERWFHQFCAERLMPNNIPLNDEEWFCCR